MRVQDVLRTASVHRNTRLRCDCGGYSFPHRIGGGACDHGPRRDYYLGLRGGLVPSEAEALLWSHQMMRLPHAVNT